MYLHIHPSNRHTKLCMACSDAKEGKGLIGWEFGSCNLSEARGEL